MTRKWLLALGVTVAIASRVVAEGYHVEKLDQAPPADLAGIKAQLADSGYKVVSAEGGTVCEIWLAKRWEVDPNHSPSPIINYPLKYGSLVGALRFPRNGTDFRGQVINPGVYSLRYALQPISGSHVGTFETRDFLVMLKAGNDSTAEPVSDEEKLAAASSEAAESAHPAIIPLLKPEAGASPIMRHIAEPEWWTVQLAGEDAEGAKIQMEMIVVGKVAE